MRQLTFYLAYAWRNVSRSRRWTAFAVLSIAAGVATIVALRSLGLAIGDSLVDNLRQANKGDITITRGQPVASFFPGATRAADDDADTFSDRDVQRLTRWARENGARFDFYRRSSNLQIAVVDDTTFGRPQFISSFLIDPATFPPTGTPILAVDPPGVAIGDLLAEPRSVVISRNLATAQAIAVGDTVRVSGTEDLFTVRGIVATEEESSFSNLTAGFFGFAYLRLDDSARLQLNAQPNAVSIALAEGTDIDAAANSLRAEGIDGFYTTLTTQIRNNEIIADVLGRFIVIMGLGALLIGGVGIINTMLVLVGRRSSEIAALKTFGLKGRQVSTLFMTEALILGVAGSLVGGLLGTILSIFVYQYGETFLLQRLVWRIYPEAIAFGVVLGMVIALVFGVLPVLTANRIRPAQVLRPNETTLPGVSALHVLVALTLIVIVVGFVAGQIVGGTVLGIIGVSLTLLILGILVGLLWIVVWLVSKLPSLGSVDLRLALRNMTARKTRTATTLLALAAGMFALSSITFVGVGTREVLNFQLAQNLGGNVLVFPTLGVVSPQLAQGFLNVGLRNIDGIDYNTRIGVYSLGVVAIDGVQPTITIPFFDEGDFSQRQRDAFFGLSVTVRESDNPNLTSGRILSGRDLTPADRGQPVLVMVSSSFGDVSPFEPRIDRVGMEVTVFVDGRPTVFTVVGIAEQVGAFSTGQAYAPPGAITARPLFEFNILQVSQARLNEVLVGLSTVPLIVALDIGFIDGLVGRFIDQFSAIPTVVGLLSLLAAAIAMANTVALATLERRRQIGVMKAVGLKGRRIVGVLLLENLLIALLGGALGIGLSALGVSLLTSLGQGVAIPIPRDALPVAIGLVAAAIVIALAATYLNTSSITRARVIDVLRYD